MVGYVVMGSKGYLLIVNKVRREEFVFGGHVVNSILETKWIEIGVSYPYPPLSPEEEKHIQHLKQFPVDGLHFYCDTFDLSRPFANPNSPSSHPFSPLSCDKEYSWNSFLRRSFDEIGLSSCCLFLLQGLFKSSLLPPPSFSSSSPFSSSSGREKEEKRGICLITRFLTF